MTHGRRVSVVGLGYVGLPVAVAFAGRARTVGFDISKKRIEELRQGVDSTHEVSSTQLAKADLHFTFDRADLAQADFHIVAVPTPVDSAHQPDIGLLLRACETLGRVVKAGDIVVFESTVYPGATEEDCVPAIEHASGLRCGVDFFVGYSPERINPGDKEHTFSKIKKVVSGSDARTLDIVAQVYESVVEAGVHRASSIKVAEAAKVIENTQRDLNIALINELALIFDMMGIDTGEVLAAAGTKWNFLPFRPGLVGGHCIGVDPYYLTHKAEKLGYISQVILAGRRINESMGRFVAQKAVKEIVRSGENLAGATVTILGLSFKENCPDLRNSRVIDVIRELQEYGLNVQVHDPVASEEEATSEYQLHLTKWEDLKPAVGVVLAVAHDFYRELGTRVIRDAKVVIDVKGVLDRTLMERSSIRYWRL